MRGLTDDDIALILHGQVSPDADEPAGGLATIVHELRTASVRAPAPAIAERHVAALVAEARRIASLADFETAPDVSAPIGSSAAAAGASAQVPVRRPPAHRGRFVPLRLAAVGLAALLAMAGLAVAGVRPPEPVADGLEALGVGVPGDDGAGDEATPGAEPQRGAADDDGHGDRAGAAQGTPRRDGAAADRGRGEGRTGAPADGRRSDRGEEASAEGRETADQALSGSTQPPEPGQSEYHSESDGPPIDPSSQAPVPTGPPPVPPDRSAQAPAAGSPAPTLENSVPPGR